MIVAKHFEWEASHQLPDKEEYGKCKNLHGHTYKLTVEISGNVNDKGWVINFSTLKEIVNRVVIDRYDHKHLNEFFTIPTAEIILNTIVNDLTEELIKLNVLLHSVTLYETSNSYVKWEA